ncbi:MAG TPA: hypothetical protein PLQ80_00570 [Candidatus Syntrophosphaera sp.]|nr:hypothetical protein [Candidatus Syntrophosphaera sp.]
MTTNNKSNGIGPKNSSLTRVQPFFENLFKQDNTGLSWLPKLINLAPLNRDIATGMLKLNCRIKEHIAVNIKSDGLPCFEYQLVPSKAFLEWLIRNPGSLSWPDNGKMTFGDNTQSKREDWFGKHGELRQKEAIAEAWDLLMQRGADKSDKEWWAFEGITKMDCLLETDDFLLGIEGKRTEKVSSCISWFPQRNQVVRNLEVLKSKSGGKVYAMLLMNEDGINTITDNDFNISLPHYSEQEIAEVKMHYLGAVSWRQACETVGLDYSALPETIRDVCQSIER